MKRVLAMVLQLCLFAFCIAACGRSEVPQSSVPVQSAEQDLETITRMGDQTDSQIQEMFTRETFTPQNLHYAIIEGGRHDMDACERYLYYALQDFFGWQAM